MMPLSEEEKEYVCDFLRQACGGTPLQPLDGLVYGVIGNAAISIIENWDTIRAALARGERLSSG